MSDPQPGRPQSFQLEPGAEIDLNSANALNRVLITFPDGTEVEFILGPNEHARLKVGSQMVPTINLLPAGEDLGELRSVD